MSDFDQKTKGVTITAELAGRTLADVVRRLCDGISWSEARELCVRGKVRRNTQLATDGALRVSLGDQIEVNPQAPRKRENVLDESLLVYFDQDLVVVNKPAGLLSVPFEDSDRNTLIDRVRLLLRRKTGDQAVELGAVQRLDKDTSGLITFTRNLMVKRKLQELFRVHDIERSYVAIAHGKVEAATCESMLVRDRGDGLRGSYGLFRRPKGPPPREAQRALTQLRPIMPLMAATVVECRLQTGRQHQIRIHLSERGHPLLGETVYIRDFQLQPIAAPRLMLHAQTLGFVHPRTGKPLRFDEPPPQDFDRLQAALRIESRSR